MEWTELERIIREHAAQQPRGFQTRLAERLGVKQPSVAQALSGRTPFPREWLAITLDALGLELTVQEQQKD